MFWNTGMCYVILAILFLKYLKLTKLKINEDTEIGNEDMPHFLVLSLSHNDVRH